MSTPELYGRDLVRLINQVVDQRLGKAFGGSPGVYRNPTITITRTGSIQWIESTAGSAVPLAGYVDSTIIPSGSSRALKLATAYDGGAFAPLDVSPRGTADTYTAWATGYYLITASVHLSPDGDFAGGDRLRMYAEFASTVSGASLGYRIYNHWYGSATSAEPTLVGALVRPMYVGDSAYVWVANDTAAEVTADGIVSFAPLNIAGPAAWTFFLP